MSKLADVGDGKQLTGHFEVLFDPKVGATSPCPQCRTDKLTIVQVPVRAYCKADCGHQYPWYESEERGCPKCSFRPHRFEVDLEPTFGPCSRIRSLCPCSSSMESASHVDAYCPKCGELPEVYETNGESFCGTHHKQMLPYQMPGNFLFAEPAARWASHQFPNSKLWGDSDAGDSISSNYCVECETTRQRWLEANVEI